MRVPNIDHDAGSPTTTARVASGAAVDRALARRASPSISLTRLAWFDANGDGRIDTRAAGAGGDATLLVPTHEVDLPTYDRAASPRLDPQAPKETGPTGATGAAIPASGNPARTQRAVDAYQRYGQAPVATPVSAAVPTAVADATSAASLPVQTRA